MFRLARVALSLSAFLAASAASAVTVTNLDDESRTVTVEEGNSSKDHVVEPGAILEGICPQGCLISIKGVDEDPYELDGPEATVIEDGQLWSEDGNDAADAPEGEAEEPTSPSSQP